MNRKVSMVSREDGSSSRFDLAEELRPHADLRVLDRAQDLLLLRRDQPPEAAFVHRARFLP